MLCRMMIGGAVIAASAVLAGPGSAAPLAFNHALALQTPGDEQVVPIRYRSHRGAYYRYGYPNRYYGFAFVPGRRFLRGRAAPGYQSDPPGSNFQERSYRSIFRGGDN